MFPPNTKKNISPSPPSVSLLSFLKRPLIKVPATRPGHVQAAGRTTRRAGDDGEHLGISLTHAHVRAGGIHTRRSKVKRPASLTMEDSSSTFMRRCSGNNPHGDHLLRRGARRRSFPSPSGAASARLARNSRHRATIISPRT